MGIPKLRTGSFFPSLLERRRVDKALFAVVIEAYLRGLPTLQDRRNGPANPADGITINTLTRTV